MKSSRGSQPCHSKALKPEWKPVAVFTSRSLFKEQLDSTQDLLPSQIKHKSEINSGQASTTIPHNIREISDDQLRPMRVPHSQSYGTVKSHQNLTNGSGCSERNASGITYDAPFSSPTGLQPKSDLKPALLNNTQHRHSADYQNGSLSSGQLSVQKAPPIPVQNKPKSSHAGQPHITSQQSGGIVKQKYKASTVNEKTLGLFYKDARTPRKQSSERKSRSRIDQHDNLDLPGQYPPWNSLSSEQKTGQDVPNNTIAESTPGRKHGLKPKVKSLNQADLNMSDGQRKSSFKKLEFSVKKFFSKGGQETTAGKDLDEGWQVTKNQNKNQMQIPQYRTHQVNSQYDDLTVERSVDGENEHLHKDRPENINAGTPKTPGIQTQQNFPIWQRNIFNHEERTNGKNVGEFNTKVRQDYNER